MRSRQGKIGDRHRVFDLILKDRLFLSIRILREDDDFLQKYITGERVFRSIVNEEEWLMRVSPTLFFEILLRNAAAGLKHVPSTFPFAAGLHSHANLATLRFGNLPFDPFQSAPRPFYFYSPHQWHRFPLVRPR